MKQAPLKKKPSFNYARYSGLSFQMIAIIFLGTWGGFKIDQWLSWGFPIFAIVLSLAAVSLAIYLFVKGL